MFNRKRTLEVFGYDLDTSKRRRTAAEIKAAPKVSKKGDLKVIDNCPLCKKERSIKLKQSKKNKPCSKCFHNQDHMIKTKQNQSKFVSNITKQKMKDNHCSKQEGYINPFKDQRHSKESISLISEATRQQNVKRKEEMGEYEYSIFMSCLSQQIDIEDWNGFTTPENTKIRQSKEGRDWVKAIFKQYNYTCDKCNIYGGSLTAHHLKPFASCPEDRFKASNGVCLCYYCHKQFHSEYGRKWFSKQDYLCFKSNYPTQL